MKKFLSIVVVLVLAFSILLFPLASPLLAAPDQNLLINPGAETGDMSGWTIIASGGNGWDVRDGGFEGDKSFATSYGWCKRYQEIDLLAKGYTAARLDAAPPVTVEEWFAGYGAVWMYDYCHNDYAYLKVELRDESHNVIDSYDTGVFQLPTGSGWFGPWEQKAHLFSDYGPGLRYIYFEDGGKDREFWAGHYGARLDAASVTILTADFSADQTEGPAPLTVQFTDESEPTGEITAWLWDFGDGESSREQNPSHTYAVGIYTVSLTVTDPYGTDREVKADYIEVFTAVAPAMLFVRNLQISPAQVYPHQQVTIYAEVVNQGGRYGSKRVDLVINGQAEQMTRAGVYPGTAQDIYFYTSKSVPGRYEVFIEGETGSFTVLLPPQAPPQPPPAGTAGGLGTGGIIAIVVIGIILIAGIIVAVMLTRRRAY